MGTKQSQQSKRGLTVTTGISVILALTVGLSQALASVSTPPLWSTLKIGQMRYDFMRDQRGSLDRMYVSNPHNGELPGDRLWAILESDPTFDPAQPKSVSSVTAVHRSLALLALARILEQESVLQNVRIATTDLRTDVAVLSVLELNARELEIDPDGKDPVELYPLFADRVGGESVRLIFDWQYEGGKLGQLSKELNRAEPMWPEIVVRFEKLPNTYLAFRDAIKRELTLGHRKLIGWQSVLNRSDRSAPLQILSQTVYPEELKRALEDLNLRGGNKFELNERITQLLTMKVLQKRQAFWLREKLTQLLRRHRIIVKQDICTVDPLYPCLDVEPTALIQALIPERRYGQLDFISGLGSNSDRTFGLKNTYSRLDEIAELEVMGLEPILEI